MFDIGFMYDHMLTYVGPLSFPVLNLMWPEIQLNLNFQAKRQAPGV